MKVTALETIKAPINKVFEAFSDVTKIEERIEGIVKAEILSDVKSGTGVRWRETRVMFGKEATEEMEMVVFEPPKVYEVHAESHGSKYHSVISFEENDGQTTVTHVFAATPVSLMAKLMTPLAFLFKGATRKALQKDMTQLKQFLESNG